MFIYCYFYQDLVLYIGSTVNIKNRQRQHRRNITINHDRPFYRYLKEYNIVYNDLEIEYLNVGELSKSQLTKLEGESIKMYKPICNVQIAGRSRKEYNDDTFELRREQNRTYATDNAERIKEYQAQYRVDN